ncbi:class I SAM-dependent methyltransferase [Galbibacter mesophilus]|uniref:class I SAM-dependent methyltransferase n=1 Tax=Galbibacter mesophilus TaxID=379069 RepID=UPI00191F99A9|nr:class I SAM-dependent methyltransferase [Galbibacter mesophilus]MCM5662273.1 class I SAM-dependent methyltransferase [Galbibacter mesophilus]
MKSHTPNRTFITVQDNLVTKEVFKIVTTEEKGLLRTIPTPPPTEIGKYYESEEYISHTDSKETFLDKIYQTVKKISLGKKKKIIRKYHSSAKYILDIGSGTGDLISYLKNDYSCYGTEPNDKARNISQTKGNTVFKSLEDIENNKFDVIMMWHVLEHVHDIDSQIEKINTLLNKNGVLIIAVPNYESYDAKYYQEDWAAYDVPRHLWHFNKTAMKSLLQKQSFFVVKILPLIFDSFYISLLSEKNKTGKQNLLKSFFIGLKSNLKAKASKNHSSLIYIAKKD